MADTFKTSSLIDGSQKTTNLVYFNPMDAAKLEKAPGQTVAPGRTYVEIHNIVFSFQYVRI